VIESDRVREIGGSEKQSERGPVVSIRLPVHPHGARSSSTMRTRSPLPLQVISAVDVAIETSLRLDEGESLAT